MARVEIRGVEVRYGDVVAVRDVDLEIPAGSITALVGPSGCGKTSLLRAIAGFEEPGQGRIVIDDVTVTGAGAWVPPERRRVGMVFQEGALFPHLTVAANVGYGLAREDDRRERVDEVLELVGIAELAERYPDELSGGQQQRVAVARALAPEPAVVLLDEPFSALDAGLRERVREEVRRVLERVDATALLVTHDQAEALGFADRAAVMASGRLLQSGTPEELYHRPASAEVARLVGSGALLPCEIRDGVARFRLGRVSTELPDGEGRVLVRPEDLLMFWATEDEPGPRGHVIRRRFFGHDILEDVELEDGTVLGVRIISSPGLPVGTPVRLRLRHQDLRVFPTA